MTKTREKLLDKFVKKDYNNDLEEVLAKKNFKEEVKNLLLDIMYRIETSYNDYEMVKKNVLPKEVYIRNLIKNIKDNCESIEFFRPDENNKKTFIVNKNKKQILCYPILRKLLYSLAKIQKCDDIIKLEPQILNKTLTNMINVGNNINMVEPLRDFNGFAWSISRIDIENFPYNIVYQDLIILVGNEGMDEWANTHNDMVDYLDLFKDFIEKQYDKKLAKEIYELLKIISIYLEVLYNKEFKEEIMQRKEYVNNEIAKMENKEKFLDDLSKEKKQVLKDIRDIDIIINDKKKLDEEYINRNKDLSLEEKIFSKRVLSKKMKEEREGLINYLKELNNKMNYKNFLKTQKDLAYEKTYLELVETKNIEKAVIDKIILLQKRVIKALKYKIRKASTRENINRIIYEIRYLNLLPFSMNENIGQNSKLVKLFENVEKDAIKRAHELKDFNELSKNADINFEILKNMFSLEAIRLEDVSLKLIKEQNEVFVQFYDDNIIDKKFVIIIFLYISVSLFNILSFIKKIADITIKYINDITIIDTCIPKTIFTPLFYFIILLFY